MAGHGGPWVEEQHTSNFTKRYWPSRKRSPKRLIVLLEPTKWRGKTKKFPALCAWSVPPPLLRWTSAPTFKFVPAPLAALHSERLAPSSAAWRRRALSLKSHVLYCNRSLYCCYWICINVRQKQDLIGNKRTMCHGSGCMNAPHACVGCVAHCCMACNMCRCIGNFGIRK